MLYVCLRSSSCSVKFDMALLFSIRDILSDTSVIKFRVVLKSCETDKESRKLSSLQFDDLSDKAGSSSKSKKGLER